MSDEQLMQSAGLRKNIGGGYGMPHPTTDAPPPDVVSFWRKVADGAVQDNTWIGDPVYGQAALWRNLGAMMVAIYEQGQLR